jgi:hypothetical protein
MYLPQPIAPIIPSRIGPLCYERTRDQGTLGSIAIAIVEPLGGHLLCISYWSRKKPPRVEVHQPASRDGSLGIPLGI